MGVEEKAKAVGQQAKGKVKEGAGRTVGNERLIAEGQGDQVVGKARHEAAKAKQSAKQTGKDASGKVKEAAGKTVGNESLTVKGKAEQTGAKIKKKLNK